MKKWIVLLIVLIPAMAWGQSTCISSGVKLATTEDNVISAVPSRLCGVVIHTNGTDNCDVEVYDDSATVCSSGTLLFKMIVVGADYRGGTIFPLPIKALNGICLNITGTGSGAEVYYTQ